MSESRDGEPELHLHRVQALYCEHRSWLQGWLQKKLGNRVDAADLMQDTFVRLLAGKALPVLVEPRAYLSCIAKGILVNWYQRQALERAYLEALRALPEGLVPAPEQRWLILETLHQIDALLDRLPALVKRTFLLSQIGGLTYQTIADQLGLSLITVKRYMKQALVQCLSLMDE